MAAAAANSGGGARPGTRPGVSHPAAYDQLPAIARAAIQARLCGRSAATDLPRASGALCRAAPVFVTLRAGGELRGCIGTLSPMHDDLVAEVADRAVAAAFEDPRFLPLAERELAGCTIEVSILEPLEAVDCGDALDPRVYGVEVADPDGRRGVLLPDIDGVDTVEQQLAIARRKAGIEPGAPIRIWRFRVVKIKEPERA